MANLSKTDPHQLHNLFINETTLGTSLTILGQPLVKVAARLDALLMVLKSCKGRNCIEPWCVLHPDGPPVRTLKEALAVEFDDFYVAQQNRVSFSRCEAGYIIDAEGPQTPVGVEVGELLRRDGLWWDAWV
jgi:hypothetical protein